ncbi:MAG: YARHG domain-containing protein [Bacteroidales bacterium]|nr:YARHG domain-containing protein [Bacteroidales bacterium]
MKTIILSIMIVIIGPNLIFANAVFQTGLHGVGIMPLDVENIQLVEEEVFINVPIKKVKCKFYLKNLIDSEKNVKILFPFKGEYDSYGEFPIPDDFFIVYIDEIKINTELSKNSQYRYVYMWNVKFEPYEIKKIICEYKLIKGIVGAEDESHEHFYYINSTGNLWAGNIKKARFKIQFGDSIKEHNPTSFHIKRSNNFYNTSVISSKLLPDNYTWNLKTGIAEYTYSNWEPLDTKTDIYFKSHRQGLTLNDYFRFKKYKGNQVRYTKKDLAVPQTKETEAALGVYCMECAQSSKKEIEASLRDIYHNYLWYLRNEIYARRGYIFKNQRLQLLFSAAPWYKENKNFDFSSLLEIEKQNVEFILRTEKKYKYILSEEVEKQLNNK